MKGVIGMGFIALPCCCFSPSPPGKAEKASPPSLSCSASSLSSRASYSAPACSASTEAITEAPTGMECGSLDRPATARLRHCATAPALTRDALGSAHGCKQENECRSEPEKRAYGVQPAPSFDEHAALRACTSWIDGLDLVVDRRDGEECIGPVGDEDDSTEEPTPVVRLLPRQQS